MLILIYNSIPDKCVTLLFPLGGSQNKPGPTQLAGDLSYALALRNALILVHRDVWTVSETVGQTRIPVMLH